MIDCKHRDGRRCLIGRYDGAPTDIQCLRKCDARVRLTVSAPLPPRMVGDVSPKAGVPWYERVGSTCESKRRFYRDWMDREWNDDGDPAPASAD